MKKIYLTVAVLSLVIGACGGGESSSTTTTEAVETTTTAAGVTTTSSEGGTTSTAGQASGGGDGCLVGDWVLDDEAFLEEVFAAAGDPTIDVEGVSPGEGTLTTSFNADGTVSALREDWGFSIESPDGTFKIVVNGEQTGTWETDGSTLKLSLEEGAALDVDTSIVVNGEEITIPDSPVELPDEALSSESEYDCDGDTLRVMSEGVTSIFNRP